MSYELHDLLKQGIICETAPILTWVNVTMLKRWLEFNAFKVIKSPNIGWVLFVPTEGESGK
jgi:hypothetical protein